MANGECGRGELGSIEGRAEASRAGRLLAFAGAEEDGLVEDRSRARRKLRGCLFARQPAQRQPEHVHPWHDPVAARELKGSHGGDGEDEDRKDDYDQRG
jgi:hypothetical protein